MNKQTKRLTIYGILIALALVLSYVESLVPAFFAVPGMKLGLTNVVVVIALYKIDVKSAVIINFVRIALVAVMFSNGASFFYSLAGGILSMLVMIVLKLTGKVQMATVSSFGGIFHNVGQIIMAIILLGTTAIGYYLAILWFVGLITGLIIGVIAAEVVKRLPDFE